jgi:hypothetical protein
MHSFLTPNVRPRHQAPARRRRHDEAASQGRSTAAFLAHVLVKLAGRAADEVIILRASTLVLTINGKAELVVQDAEGYQALLDGVETIEGSQRGWPC